MTKTMTTESLEVCGFRVLVKVDPPKERIKVSDDLKATGFQIAMSRDQEQAEEVASQTGVVVKVGPTAWKAYDDGRAWASVGDRIIFSKYSGKIIEHPETLERFMLINDEDVQLVVKG
jgi:co-chaperonin GroES (HSP10)